MISTKNVLLTFDYELFQGKKSGTVENCLLIPTAKIIDCLKRKKAVAIFFVDMMYLYSLKDAAKLHAKAERDYRLIERQIIDIANNGHYVFNHLHPHWLDATYNPIDNNWELIDTSKYSFESLTESQREFVFDASMSLLMQILDKAERRESPDGYRAGGLYIQPFLTFDRYFQMYGLKYDFSVLIDAEGELENKSGRFNFSCVDKNIYTFSTDVTKVDLNGPYIEYAMRFVKIPIIHRLLNSAFFRLFSRGKYHQRFGDGLSTSNKIKSTTLKAFTSTEVFSVEMLNDIKLPLYLRELNRNNYLHLISHPKLVSKYNLQVFEKLLEQINLLHNVEYDFKKFIIG